MVQPSRVLTSTGESPQRLAILPTRAGEARTLEGDFQAIEAAKWVPGDKEIIVAAREPGGEVRLYVIDAGTSARRPLGLEGFTLHESGKPVSPDGKHVVALGRGSDLVLVPLDGGDPRPLPGAEEGDLPIGWSSDGRAFHIYRGGWRTELYKIDLATGRRDLTTEIRPQDAAGVGTAGSICMTPDGKTIVYSYQQHLSELYLAEGLK